MFSQRTVAVFFAALFVAVTASNAKAIIVCNDHGCQGPQSVQDKPKHHRGHIRTAKLEKPTVGLPTALIERARTYKGMTAAQIGLHRHSSWCMAFLRYLGVQAPDDRAISALRLPRVLPQIGAVAVWPHHVGLVTGFDGKYPIIISGNSYQRRVYEGTYPRHPIAYVSAE